MRSETPTVTCTKTLIVENKPIEQSSLKGVFNQTSIKETQFIAHQVTINFTKRLLNIYKQCLFNTYKQGDKIVHQILFLQWSVIAAVAISLVG